MIRILFFVFLSFSVFAQKSKVIHKADLEKMLSEKSDSLTVINFWATWCKPCVAELPFFEKAREKFRDKKVRFWLVSLDFADQKKSRLDPFLVKRKIFSTVFLLDEVNYDDWIPLVDPKWEGVIPITLFVNNSKNQRKFVNGELSLDKLIEIISSHLEP
jgi:thiol-disulfide isomerase/thioredoxin